MRLGRDLEAEGVSVLAMGGSKNIATYLARFGPGGLDVKVAGLCDAGEEADLQRALERAGLGASLSRADMEGLGFFVCVVDLEDELIRSLGIETTEQVLNAQGKLGTFRSFQKQRAWVGRNPQLQLRRFIASHSGLKIQSAPMLVEALDLSRVPRPLELLLAYI